MSFDFEQDKQQDRRYRHYHYHYLQRFIHWRMILIYLIVILCITIPLATAIGNIYISPLEIVALFGSKLHLYDLDVHTIPYGHEVIIFQVRLPRIFMGILVGFALSTAGTAMQGLFKNPMADPYIIGIASGAGLVLLFRLFYYLTSSLITLHRSWLSWALCSLHSWFIT